MNCLPTPLPDGRWRCERCGYVSRKPLEKAFVKRCNPGVGDKVESLLSRIGLTKARWNAVRRFLGLRKPCGCKKRQAALNEAGRAVGL